MSAATGNILTEGLDELVALLEAAGIPASWDPGAFQPPGAMVGAPTILAVTHGGAITMSVPVYLVTPDPGAAGLAETLGMVKLALPVLGVGNAVPTLWISPLNSQGLPAHLVTITLTVSEV